MLMKPTWFQERSLLEFFCSSCFPKMAAKSSLLPLLRRISKPYMSIQKFPVLASLQSRLFHASKAPMQSILNPELGGLQRISVIGLLKSGYPASNCRNYARGRKPVSEDEDDGSEDFGDGDKDEDDSDDMDFDDDEDDKDDASDEE